jgi:hypothetical protein
MRHSSTPSLHYSSLFLFVSVEPLGGNPAHVSGRVSSARWNQKLGADRQRIFVPVHLEFFFPFHEHDKLIRAVNKVGPYLPRRIDPETERKSARRPSCLDLFLIYHLTLCLPQARFRPCRDRPLASVTA